MAHLPRCSAGPSWRPNRVAGQGRCRGGTGVVAAAASAKRHCLFASLLHTAAVAQQLCVTRAWEGRVLHTRECVRASVLSHAPLNTMCHALAVKSQWQGWQVRWCDHGSFFATLLCAFRFLVYALPSDNPCFLQVWGGRRTGWPHAQQPTETDCHAHLPCLFWSGYWAPPE